MARKYIPKSRYYYIDHRTQNGLYNKCMLVERWGDRFTPACLCGCGEPVPISDRGPAKYVNYGHMRWDKGAQITANSKAARRAKQLERNTDLETWRAAVRQIKEQRGWTLSEMAERGGWPTGSLQSWLYGRNRLQTIGPQGVDFLRRLAGLPTPPSPYQQRKARAARLHEDKIRKEGLISA